MVPLIMGLKEVFAVADVDDYSFFPLFVGAISMCFSFGVFHSVGYFLIIASDTTVKEKSELKKNKVKKEQKTIIEKIQRLIVYLFCFKVPKSELLRKFKGRETYFYDSNPNYI